MYSIKTDLGVAGNGTIEKDLLVNGNAVVKGNLQVDGTVDFASATFTQITVSGDANLADITSTGTSNLADVNVSGNTALGDSSTDSLTVQATSTFAAPVVIQQNITQTSGTASLKAVAADSIAVSGQTDLNGNLVMADGTTATLDSTVTDSLTVNGVATVGGTLDVTGKTTLQDVEINGTLSGSYTMDAGNFNSIKVSALSDLNNVSIKGSTTLTGNVTGASSTVSVNRLNMQGSDGIIEFAYNNPSRPTDTKTSIEPYQVSSQTLLSKVLTTNAADIGVVGGTSGLHALGNATIDYLNIAGNSTIGDQTQLQVAGRSVFTGKTTVGDLEITGAVSGLTFTDITGTTLTISGASALQGGVTVGGNLTGSTSAIAKFSTFTVANATGSNHGIIQFEYNDPTRPTDIKSSIEPYKVSTNDIQSRNLTTNSANIGVVGGTSGLRALGNATIDYLNIAGNSTIGTATPQLQVAGESVLHDTTVNNLTINGSVTGLTFDDLSVNTLAVSGNSTLSGGVTIGGNLTGSNASIAKFSTFTVAQGTSGNNGIIQFDYADASRPTDIKSSIEPYKVSTNDVAAKNVVSENATIGNVGGTAGLTALGTSTMDYIHVKGNSTIGTASPQLQVDGKSILGDVEFTGTVTGLAVDVSGQDLTPNSVVAAAAIEGQTLESVTTTTVGTDLSVGGIANITGDVTIGGDVSAVAGDFTGDVNVINNKITVKDLVVTGTTTGVTVAANVDGLDIEPNSVTATTSISSASASVTGQLQSGSVSTGSLTATDASTLAGVTAGATTASSLTVTGNSTLAGVSATTLSVPSITGNTTFANDVTITGTLTPSAIDLSTTDVDAKSLTTTGDVNVGGNIVVDGTVDLSAADVSVKSITATDESTLPTLNSTTATITTVDAGTVSATSVSATGNVSGSTVTSPTVQGATGGTGTLNLASDTVAAKDFTVTGSFMPNGGIVTTGDISAANVTVSSVVKAGSVESANIQAEPAGAGTVTIASDAVAAKDFTVTGTFKPEGGLDLSSVDVIANSIETTTGATIGGNLSVAGTVDLSGADVTALSFVSTDTDKINTFPKLASTDVTVGTLTATGASTLAEVSATNVTASGTLSVTGATTLSGVTAGAVSASSVTASGTVSAATFTSDAATVEIAKSTNVTGDFHASGTLTAGVIDLSNTDATVKSLESLGNAHIVGDLTVDGQFDLSATNLQASSLTSTNNTTVGADLSVTGDSSLSTLTTSGLATLDSATIDNALTVTGATTMAGLSATNVTTSGTLGVTGNSTLSTLSTSGLATLNSASVGTTLSVSGATTVSGLTAGATSATTLSTSGLATLASLDVTGNTVSHGDLTVEGTLLPQGGLDLTGADIEANSLTLASGATVGTTLGVTGNTTVGGTLTSTGAGRFGSVTSDNSLTVTTGNLSVSSGTITSSGAGSFGSVTSANGLTVTSGNATITTGNLTVSAGNIVQSGAATATASFKKTSATNLHVGTLVWDEEEYIAEVGGNVHISGDLDVDGTINAQINLTGRDIAPRSVATSQEVTVGTTLTVAGQATLNSAIIGDSGSVNNNLQINGNTTCTGDFSVQGRIIGTLDQSTSNVAALSFTATNAVKGATLESTGATTVGNALTVSAGGAAITGNSSVTGTLSVSGTLTGATVTSTGKLTVSGGGAAITGDSTVTGALAVSGALSGASLSTTGTLGAGTSTLGATTVTSLGVSGTSNFTGLATAVNLTSTGLITANDLTITGTLTTDIASLVTSTVTTKKYQVLASAAASVASGATWTPDGTTNVYNVTLTGAAGTVTFAKMPIETGKAASWFVYVTQDSTGGKTVTWGSDQKLVGTSDVNTAANSVSICQLVYCGYGSIIDVFVAQRTL